MHRRLVSVIALVALLFASAAASAKGTTVRIDVRGASLAKPVSITAREDVGRFFIWTGPGVLMNDQPVRAFDGEFIDWARGPLAKAPDDLPQYEVSFFCEFSNREPTRVAYAVSYAFDPASGQGYVYLPGSDDKRYEVNVSSILHGVEGKWFYASSAWDSLARTYFIPLR
jgi:hypothetical protein